MTLTNEAQRADLPVKVADDDVAAFLFHEARLLDHGRYDDWVDLFADDGLYWVPCNGPDIDPLRQVSIVYDDVESLRSRIGRLNTGKQYAQDPPSRTCRVLSNLHMPTEGSGEDEFTVYSSLVVFEARRQHRKNAFAGGCTYRLRRSAGGFKIIQKRVDLIDNDQYHENLTFLL